MKKVVYSVCAILLTATLLWGTTQTINTLPVSNSSFISALQAFLRSENANRFQLKYGGYVFEGGIGTTAAGLTHTITAVTGLPGGYYVYKAATSHTYTNTTRTFVFLDYDDSRTLTVVGATITRSTYLVFVEMAAASAEPQAPAKTVPLMQVDTSGGAITAVTDLRPGGEIAVDCYTSLSDAVTRSPINTTIVINTRSVTTNNTTVTQGLCVEKGGMIINDYALVIDGPFEAGDCQAFSGSGTVSFGYALSVNPLWWYLGAGVYAPAIQAAVDSIDGQFGVVDFPPVFNAGYGYTTQPVFINHGNIELRGHRTKMTQEALLVPDAGGYKASPVFMIMKAADNVHITGLDFYTDVASFNGINYSAYFASVISQNANNVSIDDCEFHNGKARGVFSHGGNYVRVTNNRFYQCGLTFHTGYTNDELFWDTPPSVNTPTYSMLYSVVDGNTFNGYTATVDQTSGIHLSGCLGFTFTNNKMIDFTATDAVRFYVNDLGETDVAGNPVYYMNGVISGNTITGTSTRGLTLLGVAQSLGPPIPNIYMDLKVNNNDIRVTGIGTWVQRVDRLQFYKNTVISSSSPLSLNGELDGASFADNYLEGTSAGESLATIDLTNGATGNNWRFERNVVVSPAGDQYAIHGGPVALSNAHINNNSFVFAGGVASPQIVTLATLTGTNEFVGNRVINTSTALTDRFPFNLSGGNWIIENNVLESSTVGLKGFSLSVANLDFNGNKTWGNCDITASGILRMSGNKLVSSTTSLGTPLTVANAAEAYITSNHLEIPASYNGQVVKLTACAISKLLANTIIGFSVAPLIATVTSGALTYWGNTVVNNGTGGTGYTTGAGTTVAAMSGT